MAFLACTVWHAEAVCARDLELKDTMIAALSAVALLLGTRK